MAKRTAYIDVFIDVFNGCFCPLLSVQLYRPSPDLALLWLYIVHVVYQ